MTLSINDTQHDNTVRMLSVVMINVAFFCCYAECHYAECRYADCRGAYKYRSLLLKKLASIDIYESGDQQTAPCTPHNNNQLNDIKLNNKYHSAKCHGLILLCWVLLC
jgi:hypothetical protein